MQLCKQHGHDVVALANLLPEESAPDELDSFCFQTVGHQLVAAYSACMGLPLFRKRISGTSALQDLGYTPTDGDEVEDLFQLLSYVKESVPGVQAVASGAIASDYQRLRVENVCSRLNLVSLAYLWHQPQRLLMRGMVESGMEAILVKVACLGLSPRKHLGRTIAALEPHLLALADAYGCNVCGEGGEYETLTLDCAVFGRGRIVLEEFEIEYGSSDVGHLVPKSYRVEPKPGSGWEGAELASDVRMVPPDYVAGAAPRMGRRSLTHILENGSAGFGSGAGAAAGREAAGREAAEREKPQQPQQQHREPALRESGPHDSCDQPHQPQPHQQQQQQHQQHQQQQQPPNHAPAAHGSPGHGNAAAAALGGGAPSAPAALGAIAAAATPASPRSHAHAQPQPHAHPHPVSHTGPAAIAAAAAVAAAAAAASPSGSLSGAGSLEAALQPVAPPTFGVQVSQVCSGPDYVQLVCRAVRTRSALPSDVTECDTVAALNALLVAAQQELAALHMDLHHCLFVHLFLANMGHFQAANGVYCKHFPGRDPPSRACVQICLPHDCPVMIDFLLARGGAPPALPPGCAGCRALSPVARHTRRVLHVQSISSWAPSCIGPYSQATSYRGLVYLAGVIPLDPPAMTLVPGDITAQVLRAMTSCEAVAVAQRTTVVGAALGLTVYLASGGAGGAELRALARAAVEALLEHGLPGYAAAVPGTATGGRTTTGGMMYGAGAGGGGGGPYSRYSRSSSNFDTGSIGSGTPRAGVQQQAPTTPQSAQPQPQQHPAQQQSPPPPPPPSPPPSPPPPQQQLLLPLHFASERHMQPHPHPLPTLHLAHLEPLQANHRFHHQHLHSPASPLASPRSPGPYLLPPSPPDFAFWPPLSSTAPATTGGGGVGPAAHPHSARAEPPLPGRASHPGGYQQPPATQQPPANAHDSPRAHGRGPALYPPNATHRHLHHLHAAAAAATDASIAGGFMANSAAAFFGGGSSSGALAGLGGLSAPGSRRGPVMLGADAPDEEEEEEAAAAAAAAGAARGGGGDDDDGSSHAPAHRSATVNGLVAPPQQCQVVLDPYLQPPEVRSSIRPSVLYVTVPSLPRGSLVEIEPVCLDVEALAVIRRLASHESLVKAARRNNSHADSLHAHGSSAGLHSGHHAQHPMPHSFSGGSGSAGGAPSGGGGAAASSSLGAAAAAAAGGAGVAHSAPGGLHPAAASGASWSDLPPTPRGSMESGASLRAQSGSFSATSGQLGHAGSGGAAGAAGAAAHAGGAGGAGAAAAAPAAHAAAASQHGGGGGHGHGPVQWQVSSDALAAAVGHLPPGLGRVPGVPLPSHVLSAAGFMSPDVGSLAGTPLAGNSMLHRQRSSGLGLLPAGRQEPPPPQLPQLPGLAAAAAADAGRDAVAPPRRDQASAPPPPSAQSSGNALLSPMFAHLLQQQQAPWSEAAGGTGGDTMIDDGSADKLPETLRPPTLQPAPASAPVVLPQAHSRRSGGGGPLAPSGGSSSGGMGLREMLSAAAAAAGVGPGGRVSYSGSSGSGGAMAAAAAGLAGLAAAANPFQRCSLDGNILSFEVSSGARGSSYGLVAGSPLPGPLTLAHPAAAAAAAAAAGPGSSNGGGGGGGLGHNGPLGRPRPSAITVPPTTLAAQVALAPAGAISAVQSSAGAASPSPFESNGGSAAATAAAFDPSCVPPMRVPAVSVSAPAPAPPLSPAARSTTPTPSSTAHTASALTPTPHGHGHGQSTGQAHPFPPATPGAVSALPPTFGSSAAATPSAAAAAAAAAAGGGGGAGSSAPSSSAPSSSSSSSDVMVTTVCCYGHVLRSLFHLPPAVFAPGVTTAQLTRRFRRAAASVLAAHGMDMSCLIWVRVWYEKDAVQLQDDEYGYCLPAQPPPAPAGAGGSVLHARDDDDADASAGGGSSGLDRAGGSSGEDGGAGVGGRERRRDASGGISAVAAAALSEVKAAVPPPSAAARQAAAAHEAMLSARNEPSLAPLDGGAGGGCGAGGPQASADNGDGLFERNSLPLPAAERPTSPLPSSLAAEAAGGVQTQVQRLMQSQLLSPQPTRITDAAGAAAGHAAGAGGGGPGSNGGSAAHTPTHGPGHGHDAQGGASSSGSGGHHGAGAAAHHSGGTGAGSGHGTHSHSTHSHSHGHSTHGHSHGHSAHHGHSGGHHRHHHHSQAQNHFHVAWVPVQRVSTNAPQPPQVVAVLELLAALPAP
ncbi:hypothetical protein HXX76_001519 [Chlamydomonas incerta]|uniref:Diphthine--ammonia ligase n=1 Tax=Chlamydomonas incerta TaxID=51695 RepID=A0A835WCB6_CHLIN|nr:hypothetical protein HXX76_001519 [Chlamydomonas incerta]|eukprot:KAG2444776.1 hypothetical protein HXX76_001519 [Chlamydomonas incerta]